MAVKIKDRVTADGKRLEKMLKDLDKLEVRIGYQAGKKAGKNGVDLANIAAFNELGTIHIPSRPFLRDSVDSNEGQINAFLQAMGKALVRGGSAEEVLKKIGVFQKGLVQEEIEKGSFAPNAPVTVKRKGSDKPLIDTGLMRQSVDYVIKEKGSSED